jgi:hypothetical protein
LRGALFEGHTRFVLRQRTVAKSKTRLGEATG